MVGERFFLPPTYPHPPPSLHHIPSVRKHLVTLRETHFKHMEKDKMKKRTGKLNWGHDQTIPEAYINSGLPVT